MNEKQLRAEVLKYTRRAYFQDRMFAATSGNLSVFDRASGREIPAKESEILRFIAEKARFSNHTATDKELALLTSVLSVSENDLRSGRKLPVRLWNRWFYGI